MPPAGYRLLYEPGLLSAAQVGFVDKKTGARLDRNLVSVTELTEEALAVDWSQAQEVTVPLQDLERAAPAGAAFSPLPAAAGRAASYTAWKRDLATWLYGTQTIELFSFSGLKMTSQPGESEQDFRFRVVQAARERRDEETEKLRQKYETKVSSLRNQILKAEQAVDREEEQMKQQKTQTAISLGATVLGAFLGGGRGIASSIGRMTTTARGAGRTMKEGKDIGRAEESLDALKKRMAQLEEDFRADADRIGADADPVKAPLERVTLRPSKTNVVVRVIALGWLPYWQREAGGEVRPAF